MILLFKHSAEVFFYLDYFCNNNNISSIIFQSFFPETINLLKNYIMRGNVLIDIA